MPVVPLSSESWDNDKEDDILIVPGPGGTILLWLVVVVVLVVVLEKIRSNEKIFRTI
jgi:hypothetical protein